MLRWLGPWPRSGPYRYRQRLEINGRPTGYFNAELAEFVQALRDLVVSADDGCARAPAREADTGPQVRIVSVIAVKKPGLIGVKRPAETWVKRGFERLQDCVFLPFFATPFSGESGIGLGSRWLLPSNTSR